MVTLYVNSAMGHNIPSESDIVYEVEERVLVFREKAINE